MHTWTHLGHACCLTENLYNLANFPTQLTDRRLHWRHYSQTMATTSVSQTCSSLFCSFMRAKTASSVLRLKWTTVWLYWLVNRVTREEEAGWDQSLSSTFANMETQFRIIPYKSDHWSSTVTPAVWAGSHGADCQFHAPQRFTGTFCRNLTLTGSEVRKERCGSVCVGGCVCVRDMERQRICNWEHVQMWEGLLWVCYECVWLRMKKNVGADLIWVGWDFDLRVHRHVKAQMEDK